jgi:hypothetical protein
MSHPGGGKCVLEDAVDLVQHVCPSSLDLPHLGEVCASMPPVEVKHYASTTGIPNSRYTELTHIHGSIYPDIIYTYMVPGIVLPCLIYIPVHTVPGTYLYWYWSTT